MQIQDRWKKGETKQMKQDFDRAHDWTDCDFLFDILMQWSISIKQNPRHIELIIALWYRFQYIDARYIAHTSIEL